MSEAIAEKAVCPKCGVGVRDGTTFCYNCGSSIAELPVAVAIPGSNSETAPVADDLAETFKIENVGDDADKLSRAADQRRKSRVGLRKPKEYTWEPADDTRKTVLFTLLIAALALTVVLATVFWK